MKKKLLRILTIVYLLQVPFYMDAQVIPVSALQEDFKILKDVLLSIHPGIYRYNSKKSFNQSLDKLKSQWQTPTNEKTALKQLAQLLENIHCGHTCINPYNLADSLKNTMYPVNGFLPLYIKIIDKKIIITGNASGNNIIKKGQEIISINGILTTTILDSLITAVKSDGLKNIGNKYNSLEISDREQFSLFDMLLPTFFDMNNEFTVNVKNFGEKELKKTVLQSISTIDRFNRISKLNGSNNDNYKDSWPLKLVDKNTAILKMSNWFTYTFKTDWHQTLKNYFNMLKEKKIRNLIIDLRGNVGGDGSVSSELLSYITNKDLQPNFLYRQMIRTPAIDKKFWPYFLPWGDTYKRTISSENLKKIDENNFQIIGDKQNPIVTKTNHFNGKVYLIIDAANSSATFNFIDAFKNHKLGIVVGQKSGGNMRGINSNDFVFLRLPNTKLRIDIPLVFNDPGYSRPDGGVLPDYQVLTKQKDIVKGNDPHLTFIKNLIKIKISK